LNQFWYATLIVEFRISVGHTDNNTYYVIISVAHTDNNTNPSAPMVPRCPNTLAPTCTLRHRHVTNINKRHCYSYSGSSLWKSPL